MAWTRLTSRASGPASCADIRGANPKHSAWRVSSRGSPLDRDPGPPHPTALYDTPRHLRRGNHVATAGVAWWQRPRRGLRCRKGSYLGALALIDAKRAAMVGGVELSRAWVTRS